MMKSLIAAAVLATASLGAAQAADVSKAPAALEILDNSAFFGDSFAAKNGGNTFADRYTFSLTGPAIFDALVSSFASSANVGLDLTAFDLFTADGDRVAASVADSTGALDLRSLHANLNSGSYFLQVQGTLVSSKSGSFAGTVALQPVPEPATYGMMLAGLGAVGFMARRRKQS